MEGSGIVDKVEKNVVDFKVENRLVFIGVLEPKV